jgi:hypothetical protein
VRGLVGALVFLGPFFSFPSFFLFFFFPGKVVGGEDAKVDNKWIIICVQNCKTVVLFSGAYHAVSLLHTPCKGSQVMQSKKKSIQPR